jgi:branched-chain amino acid transport system ATP-binding protein
MVKDMILEVRDATKSFGGLMAVDHLSLSMEKGMIFGLIGPNGSGKTTFFNLISGMYPLDSGKVIFQEQDITGLRPHCITKLGIARTFQTPAPFTKMTVLENVMVGTFIRAASMKIARKKAWEILELVRLAEKANQRVIHVTLEDRKRLELARSLATEPTLLLLDEAMAGLTPAEVGGAIELIQTLHARQLTMIIVEHVMDVILSLCQRVAVLDYGRKIAEGTPEGIVNNPDVIRAYLGERFSARR